ncbi:MAG: MarR family transcriptional regulator [Sphaerochaetaceae bacterium]|nr:MarR family transcriptional regulator [Sphaerochaetaceae bacterium]
MENKIKETMNILTRINRKLFTANDNSEDYSIGRGQINILKVIIENKNINQDQLAAQLSLDKTTIAKAVKRLESKGLIIRKKSETDRRKNELIATEKAILVTNQMSKQINEHSKELFLGINDDELQAFKNTLEKLEINLERNKKMMNEKKHIAMKVIKTIEQNENVDIDKLAQLLDKDKAKVEKIVDKLIMKELVEEKNGVLYVLENNIKKLSEHKNVEGEKKHSKDKNSKVFKMIVKHNGLTKEELIEKSGLSSEEVDQLIVHLEKKGVLEIKNGKLYVDKDALRKVKKH